MRSRVEDVRRDIAALAGREFAEHVITQEGPGEWHCGTPGTGIHHFRVICRRGTVIVWGDIGDWILNISDRDSLGWLRGSVRSPDYLLSKVRAGEVKQFYSGDALDHLHQEIAELRRERPDSPPPTEAELAEDASYQMLLAVQEQLGEHDDFSEHDWHQAWYDHGADEIVQCLGPSNGGWWLVEALRWFVAHVDQPAASQGATV